MVRGPCRTFEVLELCNVEFDQIITHGAAAPAGE